MANMIAFKICIVLVAICGVTGNCPDVSRDEWGARPPVLAEPLILPVHHVVIHHTYIPPACANTTLCRGAMRAMQDFHQLRNGWNDIGYSFCVGGDGLVYEGRGWDRVGAHAPKYNDKSIGICLIGDFRAELPSPEMLSAVKTLIACGIARGTISSDYQLIGHRQVRNTECPGGALFAEIQSWPHFSPMTSSTTATTSTTTSTELPTVQDSATTTSTTTSTELPTLQDSEPTVDALTETNSIDSEITSHDQAL